LIELSLIITLEKWLFEREKKKKIEIKEPPVRVISKALSRTNSFHERTSKEPAVLFLVPFTLS
jgi:hypothetical protein